MVAVLTQQQSMHSPTHSFAEPCVLLLISNDPDPLSNGVPSGKKNPPSAGSDETAAAGSSKTETAEEDNEEGSAAERLQAVEALCPLARSGGVSSKSGRKGTKGGAGDARSAAMAVVSGNGGSSVQAQSERLAKTAEFFLEAGFFAPAGEGVYSCFSSV